MKLERIHRRSLRAGAAPSSPGAVAGTLLVPVAFLALLGVGGCATTVANPEQDMPGAEHIYRRLPGGAGKIFAAAKEVLDDMGFRITGAREGEGIQGVRQVGLAHKPILVWLTIHWGDRVYVRFYNLPPEEVEKWQERTYRELEAAIKGTPAQREKQGRPKQSAPRKAPEK